MLRLKNALPWWRAGSCEVVSLVPPLVVREHKWQLRLLKTWMTTKQYLNRFTLHGSGHKKTRSNLTNLSEVVCLSLNTVESGKTILIWSYFLLLQAIQNVKVFASLFYTCLWFSLLVLSSGETYQRWCCVPISSKIKTFYHGGKPLGV